MENDRIVAEIEGIAITQTQVDDFIKMLGENDAPVDSDETRRRVCEELINQELLYMDAKKNQLDQDASYLAQETIMKKNLLKQFAMDKILSGVMVSDEDLVDYYESHQDLYENKVEVEVSHILLQKESEAFEVSEKIKNGLSFENAAQKFSTCSSKSSGGYLGKFILGEMDKEFEEKALSLDVDEVSEPVYSKYGYHLIKLHSKNTNINYSFDDIKDELARQFLLLKQQEAYLNKVAELRKAYTIKNFYTESELKTR